MKIIKITGVYVLALFWILTTAYAETERVLVYDDFNGPELDSSIWCVGNWWLGGRTVLGNEPFFQADGDTTYAVLSLDTYHPEYPGTALRGSELFTYEMFERSQTVIMETRARVYSSEQKGMIASFFTWGSHDENSVRLDDEIDFEVITAKPLDQILLTTFNDFTYTNPQWSDGIHHWNTLETVSGFNYGNWNTYKLVLYPDHTEWFINDVFVWSTDKALANNPMALHINFWAPASDWVDAYEPTLQPAANEADNQSFYYDIDYVRISVLEDDVIQAPEVPTDFSGSVFNKKTVVLNWTDQSSNETAFEIYRAPKPPRKSSPVYVLAATVPANTEEYSETPGSGVWYYKVRAVNENGASDFSQEMIFRTK